MDARLHRSKTASLACAIATFTLSMSLKNFIIWSLVPVYGSVPVYAAFYGQWLATHEPIFAAFAAYALAARRLSREAYLSRFKLWCEGTLTSLAVLIAVERPLLYPLSSCIAETRMVPFLVCAVECPLGIIWIQLAFEASPEIFRRSVIANRQPQVDGPFLTEVRNHVLLVILAVRAMMYFGIGMHRGDAWLASLQEQIPHVAKVNRSLLQVVMLGLITLALRRALRRSIILLICGILASAATMSSMRVANVVLQRQNFTIVHREESSTGYLSVLEHTGNGLRVLRQDHSLLGGVWLLTPERRRQGLVIEESVYSVFYMLEAVRLMEVEGQPSAADSSSQSNALFIGLGIGTAPSAFATHGINTTTIELDPGVSRIAKDYFSLHEGVNVQTADALVYVQGAQPSSFDYIVHDVFAGGAEPKALFTKDFLHSLKSLLKPDGSIAVNYAGNLNSPSTLQTLKRVHDSLGHCKIFRDNDPPEDAPKMDFANLVVFCSSSPWRFRQPIERDFLRSSGRQQHLLPKHKVTDSVLTRARVSSRIVRDDRMTELEDVHNAKRHRKIMRDVLPHAVWENY